MRVIIHFSQNNATQRSAAQWIRRLPCLERRRSGAQRCEQLIWILHSVYACARFGRSERFAQSLRPLRSLASAASLPRSGRSARSLRGLCSVAQRPSLHCSALSAPSARLWNSVRATQRSAAQRHVLHGSAEGLTRRSAALQGARLPT